VEPQVRGFLAGLPASLATPSIWRNGAIDPALNEGLSIPAQVNYVAKGANLYSLGYQLHGSVSVISNLLRTGYLWDRIRVQGGAYGAFCRFSTQSGVFSYLSYRDPNLLATLDAYDAAANFLRTVDLSQDELTKSIIGAIGVLDAYQLPDAKGETSMTRYLLGETDEERQKYRDEVLGTTLADFRAFADVLREAARAARVVVMGSADALAAANQERGDFLQVRQVL
jgi:Zn-dependent M16 (insulinase) family peptidase